MLTAQNLPNILTSVHRRAMRLMDIIFEISVVANDDVWANERITNAFIEIARLENLLTADNQQGQASLINANAGVAPVKIDQSIYNLIDRSLKISELTRGTFDITQGPEVDYRNIILNPANTTVFLKEKGMKIDFGGVAKGYIADRVKYVLQMQGVSSGVVNASGSLITWGLQPDGSPWTIVAAAPNEYIASIANLNISNMAVVTSGDNGYFNNKTGLWASGIKSVSILSPSAELADAMRAPVMIMGVKVSLKLINHLNQIGCIITNNRKKVYTSKNLAYR